MKVALHLADPDRVAPDEALMSPEERARHARILHPGARRRYAVARRLVRTTLGECLGRPPESLVFEIGARGKPRLAGGEIEFNLSHTEGCVVLAIAEVPVGVDVEHAGRPAPLDLVDRWFTPREVEALLALPEDARAERFLALWTLKEAYLKVRGVGLSIPLDRFGFDLEAGARLFRDPRLGDDAPYSFVQFAHGAHRLAVGVLGEVDIEVELRHTLLSP